MRLPASKEKPGVPMATPAKPEPKPATAKAMPASVTPESNPSAPSSTPATTLPTDPVSQGVRAPKAPALKRVARVELNCTPGRKEQIRKTAEALGLSASDYLLLCEEEGCQRLLQHVIGYWDVRLKALEEAIRQRQDPPPETS